MRKCHAQRNYLWPGLIRNNLNASLLTLVNFIVTWCILSMNWIITLLNYENAQLTHYVCQAQRTPLDQVKPEGRVRQSEKCSDPCIMKLNE